MHEMESPRGSAIPGRMRVDPIGSRQMHEVIWPLKNVDVGLFRAERCLVPGRLLRCRTGITTPMAPVPFRFSRAVPADSRRRFGLSRLDTRYAVVSHIRGERPNPSLIPMIAGWLRFHAPYTM